NPYPALLWLLGKRACVIGGGRVALHRVEGLLNAGVDVRVVAPEIDEGIRKLVEEGDVRWEQKPFSASLLQGVSFVVCATNDPDVNRQAAWAAKAMGALVNMAAPPLELSDFTVPASVRRGDLLFAVSTGGACPELSRRLRGELDRLCDIYEPWLERLVPIRVEMKENLSSSEERKAFWREALSEETMALVREGKIEKAEELVRNAVGRSRAES
ncbi:MAG: bifunctional precorrin-2 dehydrogenase/sirohydrochlorin ferrochelatase, partial [Schwartzia sp.]|nr:bifunctional precorrin-2 dehydrogenase/sirohydrochlorin ferrochelatase [Schwartzia sp. (in: firmicutes)]